MGILADERDLFEERAAVREYDGGLSRALAERLAARDVAEWCDPPDLPAATLDRAAALFDATPTKGSAAPLTPEEELAALDEYTHMHAGGIRG